MPCFTEFNSKCEPSLCIAITSYCPSVPGQQNGYVTSVSTAIGGVAAYTCSNGYTAGSAGAGFAVCTAYNSTIGSWTPINGSCVGARLARFLCNHSKYGIYVTDFTYSIWFFIL